MSKTTGKKKSKTAMIWREILKDFLRQGIPMLFFTIILLAIAIMVVMIPFFVGYIGSRMFIEGTISDSGIRLMQMIFKAEADINVCFGIISLVLSCVLVLGTIITRNVKKAYYEKKEEFERNEYEGIV